MRIAIAKCRPPKITKAKATVHQLGCQATNVRQPAIMPQVVSSACHPLRSEAVFSWLISSRVRTSLIFIPQV